jgi:hypothetical protein
LRTNSVATRAGKSFCSNRERLSPEQGIAGNCSPAPRKFWRLRRRAGVPLAVARAAEGRDFPARWLCFGNGEIVGAEMYDAAMCVDRVA